MDKVAVINWPTVVSFCFVSSTFRLILYNRLSFKIQVKDPSDSQQIDQVLFVRSFVIFYLRKKKFSFQELELPRAKEISEEVQNFIKSPYDYTITPTANGNGIKELLPLMCLILEQKFRFLSDDDNSFTVDIPGVQGKPF